MTASDPNSIQAFRRLHGEGLLVLPNVWDAGSARLIESLGAKALRGLVPADRRVEETLARARRYRAAGADGIFVPGIAAAPEIRAVASAAGLPLNVLAWPGLPPASELEALGVRRLSAGSGLAQAAFGRIAALAAAFLRTGASDPLAEGGMPYAEINALLSAR